MTARRDTARAVMAGLLGLLLLLLLLRLASMAWLPQQRVSIARLSVLYANSLGSAARR